MKSSFARPGTAPIAAGVPSSLPARIAAPPLPPSRRASQAPPVAAAASPRQGVVTPSKRTNITPMPPRRAPVAPAPQVEEEVAEAEVLPPEETQQEEAAPAVTPPPVRRGRGPAKPKVAAPSTTLAVIPQTGNALVIAGGSGVPSVGQIMGDFDQSDLQLPQLKIANAVGPLSLLEVPVPISTIVVGSGDQWLWLWQEGCVPVGVTVVWAKKQFSQVKDENGNNLFDMEQVGLTFDTKDEMQAAGGTLADVPGMLVCQPQLTCLVLVRMPEGLEDDLGLFGVELDGQLYMLALWYIRGSSYNECAKKINSERTGFLANGSHTGEFAMEGKRIIGKKNSWWIPKLTNGTPNSETVVDYLVENA